MIIEKIYFIIKTEVEWGRAQSFEFKLMKHVQIGLHWSQSWSFNVTTETDLKDNKEPLTLLLVPPQVTYLNPTLVFAPVI